MNESASLWRFWPSTILPGAKVGRLLVIASTVAFLAYLGATMELRFELLMDPWSCDGDHPQAVWHYWRYQIEGAFPPGDLMTDYAFVMHAPAAWWLMMASLSSLMSPLWAAKLLNIVAYLGTIGVMYFGVAKRSNHFVGLAAAFLLARNVDFHGIIAGGYARSFGPMLVTAFLGAFMLRRHKTCLVLLVVQAALYPSVVMPCGLAYGAYTVIAGPTMRARLQRMAGMLVAGLMVIGLGLYQDIQAPKWWGSVVWLDEALQMPSWQQGGRITEAPLKPVVGELRKNFTRAIRTSGHVPLPAVTAAIERNGVTFIAAASLLAAVAYTVVWRRRRRRGLEMMDPFPWQILVVGAGALAAYFLARALAFKLYLPYRALAHVLPYLFYAAGPLMLWSLLRNVVKDGRAPLVAGVLTLTLTVGPACLLVGDGIQGWTQAYYSVKSQRGFFEFIQKLPIDKQLAGQIAYVDRVPLFSWHRVYVTKALAHPFRPGYYAEAERRLRLVYTALYATSLPDVVRAARAEKIDFLVYGTDVFSKLDSRLFQPITRDMGVLFKQNKQVGFALMNPPESAIVYREGKLRVLSIDALAASLAGGAGTLEAPGVAKPAPDDDVNDGLDAPNGADAD